MAAMLDAIPKMVTFAHSFSSSPDASLPGADSFVVVNTEVNTSTDAVAFNTFEEEQQHQELGESVHECYLSSLACSLQFHA